jgi:hypothetical protein
LEFSRQAVPLVFSLQAVHLTRSFHPHANPADRVGGINKLDDKGITTRTDV